MGEPVTIYWERMHDRWRAKTMRVPDPREE